MQPQMYEIIVPEFQKLLGAMKGYFDKAVQHADQKKYDVANLFTARLTPDQYALGKQVEVTCFLAEECLGRLAGQVPPKREKSVNSVATAKERIDLALSYISGLSKESFQGWEERPVDIFFAPGKYLPGYQYLTQLGIPNLHFHLVTVYAILRHNGVDVGKMDYLGPVSFLDKK